jgi:hypothetical protein
MSDLATGCILLVNLQWVEPQHRNRSDLDALELTTPELEPPETVPEDFGFERPALEPALEGAQRP